ncbi:MAG: GntR family transcriptional regulator [Ignavibacteriaceae bacterium]|nr:GntR family transcriptional regulator [Ignavibacteriaceae bacterium]
MIVDKTSPIPSYFQLQTWLKEQIQQGIFKLNDKIPTEEELVKLTGLARATVRQAIQNLSNMGYLVRKKGLGTFVTTPLVNPQKQIIIGIIVPDIRNGYAPELARGAEDEAAKNKHSLILCSSDDLFVKAEFHANRLIENYVSGVIFVPTSSSDNMNKLIVQKFQEKNIPVVLADRTIPNLKLDFVTTDNFEGAFNLTNYLISKGHKKIAFVYSNIFSTERLRFEGYKKALEDNGIQIDKSIVVSHSGPFNDEQFSKYAASILKQRKKISAIFAGHDRIALTFYLVAKNMGLSFPEDLSIVGYDDLNFTTIPLTTMHQPIYEMGVESMKLINSRISGENKKPKSIILNSFLMERDSVLVNK